MAMHIRKLRRSFFNRDKVLLEPALSAPVKRRKYSDANVPRPITKIEDNIKYVYFAGMWFPTEG